MAVGAIVAGVAAAGSAVYKSRKNRKGARRALAAQDRANALYQDNYEETQSDYAPYQEGGAAAYDALLKSYGLGEGQGGKADYSGFENSPDYQFNLQQGVKARDTSAASTGRLYSGAYDKALNQYGQGLASNHLNTYRQGLQGIANNGMNSNNVLSNYRLGFGNQLGQGYTNIGDIQLARQMAQGQIGAQFLNSLGSIAGSYGGQSSYGGGGTTNTSGFNYEWGGKNG